MVLRSDADSARRTAHRGTLLTICSQTVAYTWMSQHRSVGTSRSGGWSVGGLVTGASLDDRVGLAAQMLPICCRGGRFAGVRARLGR
jgi:hypothetical protein